MLEETTSLFLGGYLKIRPRQNRTSSLIFVDLCSLKRLVVGNCEEGFYRLLDASTPYLILEELTFCQN